MESLIRPKTRRTEVARFIARQTGIPAASLSLDVRNVRGGLEGLGVRRVVARNPSGAIAARLIVKDIQPHDQRELWAYAALRQCGQSDLAPRLLGHSPGNGTTALYLEEIVPWKTWPWRDFRHASRVLEALALVHSKLPRAPFEPGSREAGLLDSATATLGLFESVVCQPALSPLARFRPELRRVVQQLPEIRRVLLEGECVLLHGDVHPGNVRMTRRRGKVEPVLLDWGSVRNGSPLEDVASWLQSLGFWEPEVRRKHDTLLGQYLRACRVPPELSRTLRHRYWLAAACNALAGALRYHLWVTSSSRKCVAAWNSWRAARDWLRIVRRADACWRELNRAGGLPGSPSRL